MNREYLEGLGLEKDVIDNIMKEHGKAVSAYKKKADDYDTLETKHQTALNDLKIDYAIKNAIGNSAHDADLIISQLDRKAIKVSKAGEVSGIDEQIEALKESKAFLFKLVEEPVAEEPEPTPAVDVSGLVPAASIEDGGELSYEERLTAARQSNNSLEATKIIEEAAEKGITLI